VVARGGTATEWPHATTVFVVVVLVNDDNSSNGAIIVIVGIKRRKRTRDAGGVGGGNDDDEDDGGDDGDDDGELRRRRLRPRDIAFITPYLFPKVGRWGRFLLMDFLRSFLIARRSLASACGDWMARDRCGARWAADSR
jgi:hypothetical protein